MFKKIRTPGLRSKNKKCWYQRKGFATKNINEKCINFCTHSSKVLSKAKGFQKGGLGYKVKIGATHGKALSHLIFM